MLLRAIAILATLLAGLATGVAQTYPTKPIRIIIGPSPDAVARVVGQHLQETWGEPVVIEARTGAGGALAAAAVANAEPDGHTLLFATPSYTLNTVLKTASYDALRDFQPVGLIGTGAYTLVVHPSVAAKSFVELIALAKTQPGTLNCASAGIGTAPQIACEAFNKIPGVNIVHVPYRNVNEAMSGVVGNHVQMFVAVSLVARQQMQAGTVRALATTGAKRSQLLPDLPTIAESGYPDIVLGSWNGFFAPARTPRPVLEKINSEVLRAIEQPNVRERLIALGQEFQPLDLEGYRAFVAADLKRWSILIDQIGRERLVSGGP